MKKFSHYILVLIIALGFNCQLMGQDEPDTYDSYLQLFTKKNSDNTRTFRANLLGEGAESLPVVGAEIKFFNFIGDEKTEIGKATTDKKGDAIINLPEDFKYIKEIGGLINVKAEFEGTDALEYQEAEVNFKDLIMTMTLAEIDSVKTITVTANSIDENGEEIPVNNVEFKFFIDGLFSRLPIGDGYLENGKCVYEFPNYLKGDYLGNMNIYAAFVDDDNFLNVEKADKAQWGTHREHHVESSRELWTIGAPFWMIITLTILLIGVWSHYVYAIIQLVLIKKEGKQLIQNKDV